MKALSIKQPLAELILRGEKTIELRTRSTKYRGRIYIYAALKDHVSTKATKLVGGQKALEDLPRGVIVGTVEIFDCRKSKPGDKRLACIESSVGSYSWFLKEPKRISVPRAPLRHPQPIFFTPF